MSTHFDVRYMGVDEATYSRHCHIRLGSGRVSFESPVRAGVGNVHETDVYDAYRRLSPEIITKSINSENYTRTLDREISKRCRGRFNIFSLVYGEKDRIPTANMVEHMSDIQYNHTDVIVTPSWFPLVTRETTDVELYINLTDGFLEASGRLNHKPIMVSIPQSIPPRHLDTILARYIGRDVTSFCIDSNSRALLNGTWMRRFQTSVEKAKESYGIEKECVIYSINAYQGMVKRNEDRVEAKDFLGFTAGVDIIGGKHTPAFSSRNEDDDRTVARRFDPTSYSYVKVPCSVNDKQSITDESVRIQIEEMEVIRRSISEGTLRKLLTSKNLPEITMNSIYSLKGNPSIKRLDEFI